MNNKLISLFLIVKLATITNLFTFSENNSNIPTSLETKTINEKTTELTEKIDSLTKKIQILENNTNRDYQRNIDSINQLNKKLKIGTEPDLLEEQKLTIQSEEISKIKSELEQIKTSIGSLLKDLTDAKKETSVCSNNNSCEINKLKSKIELLEKSFNSVKDNLKKSTQEKSLNEFAKSSEITELRSKIELLEQKLNDISKIQANTHLSKLQYQADLIKKAIEEVTKNKLIATTKYNNLQTAFEKDSENLDIAWQTNAAKKDLEQLQQHELELKELDKDFYKKIEFIKNKQQASNLFESFKTVSNNFKLYILNLPKLTDSMATSEIINKSSIHATKKLNIATRFAKLKFYQAFRHPIASPAGSTIASLIGFLGLNSAAYKYHQSNLLKEKQITKELAMKNAEKNHFCKAEKFVINKAVSISNAIEKCANNSISTVKDHKYLISLAAASLIYAAYKYYNSFPEGYDQEQEDKEDNDKNNQDNQ